jgi:hypothetical protein
LTGKSGWYSGKRQARFWVCLIHSKRRKGIMISVKQKDNVGHRNIFHAFDNKGDDEK